MTDAWWQTTMERPDPADPTVVSIDDVDVAIVAGIDGLIAFDDTCTHRACPLSEGVIEGGTVTCPCHKSRFDLTTGLPLNGPATEAIRIRRVEHDGTYLRVER